MLKSIVIKNFQSHKKTIIRLTKGVNFIVGRTQAGKTAILRALGLVINNRPSGGRFVRHGENTTSVTVKTYEGNTVKIKKTPTERIYYVNKRKFRKFGTKVPEEVTQVLRMSSINIQSQLDPPFLVTSSGGEITKTINRITKSEKVDKWIQSLTRDINDLKSEEETLDEEIKGIKKELQSLEFVDSTAIKIKEGKRTLSKRVRVVKKWDDIKTLIADYKEYSSQLNMFKRTIRTLDGKMVLYGNLDDQINELNDDIDVLGSFIFDSMEKIQLGRRKEKLKNEFIKLIKKKGLCPTCFGDINSKVIRRIERSI